MKEIWKPVPGYEGRYEVSNYSRVKSLNYRHSGNSAILKEGKEDKKGHLSVRLGKESKKYLVYHLSFEAFFYKIPEGYLVHHKDGNPLNNYIGNLCVCSLAEHNKEHDYNRKTNNKVILQFDKSGNFIKEWNSITNAVNEYGYGIHDNVTGRSKSAYGFIWKYK